MLSLITKKTHKLYVDLLFVFVTLFLVTTMVIIGYMKYSQYEHNVDFSKQLAQQNGDLIADEIDAYLKPARISELVEHLFHNGSLSFTNEQYLVTFLEGVLRAYPYMSAVYMVDNQGNFVNELRASSSMYKNIEAKYRPPDTEFLTLLLHRNPGLSSSNTGSWLYKDNNGNIIGERDLTSEDDYNPYTRPWYLGAQDSSSKYWLEVYRFYASQELGLTVSYRVYDSNNHLVGVIATDFDIDALSQFLKNKKFATNEKSFVINNKQELIAYSDLNSTQDAKNDLQILTINEIKDAPITSVYQAYLAHKQNTFLFSDKGVRYIAYLKDFSYADNKSWTIGLIAPLDDFMGPLKKTTNFALIFSFTILAIGIAIIVIISRNISQPIVYLAQEMNKIKDMKLEGEISLKTRIAENQIMINALNAMRASLKSFSAYVPQELVAQLISRGEIAKLGFQRRELTILFADITGFSRISEKISQGELTDLLAEYFKTVTEVIRSQQGTIDKYTGDGLMAFWGAPPDDADHMIHACRTALLCQKKIHILNQRWHSQDKPVFITRFGLDSGNTLVGNLGSPERMNYTAVGDVVNLASHLQALNKLYNTSIIVSEHIYAKCHKQFIFRHISQTRVKSGARSIDIYELVAEKKGATAKKLPNA